MVRACASAAREAPYIREVNKLLVVVHVLLDSCVVATSNDEADTSKGVGINFVAQLCKGSHCGLDGLLALKAVNGEEHNAPLCQALGLWRPV